MTNYLITQIIDFGIDSHHFIMRMDNSSDGEYDNGLGEIFKLAFQHGHIDIMKLAIDKGGGNIGNYINDALLDASSEGEMEMIKFLLENGADINVCFWGHTSLDLAACCGNLDAVKFLLDNGANITDRTLSVAVKNGYAHVAKFLLENGAVVKPYLIGLADGHNYQITAKLLKDWVSKD